MNNATKRAILRAGHLILSIPLLGYVYGKPEDVAPYAGAVRYGFFPIILFTGYWMYAGWVFAALGVAAWVGAVRWSGFGAALLGQIVLFAARKIWTVVRARRRKEPFANTAQS